MIVGYARVSTDSQTLDAQQSALSAAGAERVFAEKVSGAITDRKALGKAIAALGCERCFAGHSAGSAGEINPGSPQCPRRCQQSWGRVQVAR